MMVVEGGGGGGGNGRWREGSRGRKEVAEYIYRHVYVVELNYIL